MSKHIITNKNRTVWVCRDKTSYTLTTDKTKAIVFESEENANAVFKSNLSKLIKSKGVTVQALEAMESESVPAERSSVTPDIGSSKYIISVLSEAVAKLNVRHQELAEEQSKFDGQVTDIEHYIEFNAGKLNACSGYKAYKLLQDVLVQRRKVKDELQIIQVVRDRMNIEDIANVEQKIKELEARVYKPRELTYLFETKEKMV